MRRTTVDTKQRRGALVKFVGLGPFPMPFEKRRIRKAEAQARRMLEELRTGGRTT